MEPLSPTSNYHRLPQLRPHRSTETDTTTFAHSSANRAKSTASPHPLEASRTVASFLVVWTYQTTGVAPNQTICRQSSKQTCRQPPVPTPAGGEETRQQPPTRTVGSIKIYVRCERLIYMCYCLSALIPLVSVAVALAPLNLL